MNCKTIIFTTLLSATLSMEAEAPSKYYNTADGLSGTANLLSALNGIVGDPDVASYKGLWEVMKTADVDANGKIWDMYSTKRWNPGSEQCGNYKNIGDCYNREHSFPKSWFNDATPMYSDAYHIYPTDGKVNSMRSNYPFGECANGKSMGSYGGVTGLGRIGASTFSGYSGQVYEPDDEYKGDFARSYFYMAAAYYTEAQKWNGDMLSNSSNVFTPWAINLLLKWHRQDPVSDKELARNEAVAKVQGNRNPFIDHPELAEYIWGEYVGERWYADANRAPVINSPLDGSTVDMGITSVGLPLSVSLTLRGSNLTSSVTASVNSTYFKLSQTTFTAANVNDGTAVLTITYQNSKASTDNAVLTLKCGSLTTRVNLRAQTFDGIPALPATNIDESSFTANWKAVGNEKTYELYVQEGGANISGYPVSVTAAAESYIVENLSPETKYSYYLKSSTMSSNVVEVTTASLFPAIYLLNEDALEIYATAGEPSEALEIWFEIENIDSDINVSVKTPFQISIDKTNWKESVMITPDESRVYVRIVADSNGDYETSITFRAGNYVNDGTTVFATVNKAGMPAFFETFETGSNYSYASASFDGSAATWMKTDFGVFNEDAYEGNYAGRFGKTSSSSITTSEPKADGLGTISFYAKKYGTDEAFTFEIEYSADKTNWTSLGSFIIDSSSFDKEYSASANVPGLNYLRLRQTAGKRGVIDNLVVTDCKKASDSLNSIVDSSNNWDAYCFNNSLVIENNFENMAEFFVYTVDGIVMYNRTLPAGVYNINLFPGVYLVGCDGAVRKVVVR